MELWLSFKSFDGRCSLRSWVFRIAHNVGASHITRSRRRADRLVELEAIEQRGMPAGHGSPADELLDLIHRLRVLDRQLIMLHLEGETAAKIPEITGLSAVNVATKIHRIKRVLRERYFEGAPDARS